MKEKAIEQLRIADAELLNLGANNLHNFGKYDSIHQKISKAIEFIETETT